MFQTVTEKKEFKMLTQNLCVCNSSSIRNSSEDLLHVTYKAEMN